MTRVFLRAVPSPGRRELTAGKRTDGQEKPAFAFAFGVFLVLGIIIPAWATTWHNMAVDRLTVILIWLVVAYAAFSLARLCYYGPGQITRLSFFVFVYVFMGVPVLAQTTSNIYPLDWEPGTGDFSQPEIRRAYLSIMLGVVAYEVFFWTASIIARGRTAAVPAGPGYRRMLSQPRVLVLSALGLLLTIVLIMKTGISPFFDSRQAADNAVFGQAATSNAFDVQNKAQGALLAWGAKASDLLSLFGIVYLKRRRLWRNYGRLETVVGHMLITLLVVANVIVNNPIGNSRFWFGMVLISLASAFVPVTKASRIRWVAVLALGTLLFAFTTLQAFRRASGPADYSLGLRPDLQSSGSYVEFEMEMIGLRWLETNNHTDGRQFLGAAAVMVPRSFWQNKPVDTGNLILNIYNPAASLWTEGEVEAGPLGIVVYFGFLGWLCSAADRRFLRAPPGSLIHASVPILGGFLIFLLRGSLQPAFSPAYCLAVGLWVMTGRVAAMSEGDHVMSKTRVAS